MKKLLSVILAVAMIASLFCVVPASAAAAVYGWPYNHIGFEDGEARISQSEVGSATVSVVDGGALGTDKAAKMTIDTAKFTFYRLCNSNKGLITGEDYVITAGDTVKFSMYVKIPYAYQTGNIRFMMHSSSSGAFIDSNATDGLSGDLATFDPTLLNTWQKVSFEYVAPVTAKIDGSYGICFQFGDRSARNAVVDSSITAPEFYVDEIEFSVSHDTSADVAADKNLSNRVIYSNDFSENTNGIASANGIAGALNSDGYFELTDNSTTEIATANITLPENLKPGGKYLLQMKVKVKDGAIDGTAQATSAWAHVRLRINTSTLRAHFNPGTLKNNDAWTTLNFVMDSTDAGMNTNTLPLAFWMTNSNTETAGDTMVVGIDDVKVIDFGPVMNGDAAVVTNWRKFYNSGDGNGSGSVSADHMVSLFGWSVEGTNTAKPTVGYGYDSATGGTDSTAASVMLEFKDFDTKIYAAADLTAGAKYQLKAKLRAGTWTSAGPVDIGMVYTTASGDSTVKLTTVTTTTNNTWKDCDVEFTVPADATAAKLYFSHKESDGTPGTGTSSMDSGRVYAFVDNIEFIQKPLGIIPSVTGLTVTGTKEAGSAIGATYGWKTIAGAYDASIVKVLSENGGILAILTGENTYAITEANVDKVKYIEVLPVSSAGYFGTPVRVEVPAVPVAEPEQVVEMTVEDNMLVVYSNTYIEGARLIFVSYDANGKMIDAEFSDEDSIIINADMPEAYEFPTDLEAGVTRTAMLLENFTTLKPLAASVDW